MPKILTSVQRINYWTTASLEPAIEAISKEVFDLARHFKGARVFGLSPHFRLRFGRNPLHIGCHPRLDPLLRVLIPLIEQLGDLNHIYAEITPWIYFKTLRRKPTVLTIASEKGEINEQFFDRVDAIVVQTELMRSRLICHEKWKHKVELIYPGVDLTTFRPRSPSSVSGSTARVLFATFPRSAEELEKRGVNLLLDLARALPDVEFVLIGRPWATGNTAEKVVRSQIGSLKNVRLTEGRQSRMEELYQHADFVVIPYTTPDGGKECPLSLIEGLASGLPALVSGIAPVSGFVEAQGCGFSFDLNAESFKAALKHALQRYDTLRHRAIEVASEYFDKAAMLRKYSDLYEKVLTSRNRGPECNQ